MTILPRYLLKTYFPPFFLCLSVALFVLFMNHFLRLFNMALMKGISLQWILLCFAQLLPYFLSLALPMAYLVALLLALGQLSENGEIMALRSSGYSFREMLAPFFALAMVLSALLFYINHKASPEGYHAFKNSYATAASQMSHLDLEPRRLMRLGDWQFYAEGVDEQTGRLSGVRLVKIDEEYKWLRISAPEGRAQLDSGQGVHLELFKGSLHWQNQNPLNHTACAFGRYRLWIPLLAASPGRASQDLQELTSSDLRKRLQDAGLNSELRREYTTGIALRSAGSLAPFVLFWVGCPLGVGLDRRSRAIGFVLSLIVVFAYYGLLALGIGLGRRSLTLSALGPWLPNAACLACGVALWWRQSRR